MKFGKKILFSILSIFLIYQSYGLMNSLIRSTDELHAGFSFLLAYLLCLFVTGVFAFLGFAFPTHKILPASYYKIKHPNTLKTVHRIMCVKYFQSLLMLFFWGKKNNRKKFFNGTRSGLKNFVYMTKQSEIGHLMPFVVLCILSLVLLKYGYYWLVFFLMMINIIGNLYPIILQRYHRIRLGRFEK